MWPFKKKHKPVPILLSGVISFEKVPTEKPVEKVPYTKPHVVLVPHKKFIDLMVWEAKNPETVAFNSATANAVYLAKVQIMQLNNARVKRYMEGYQAHVQIILQSLEPQHFWVKKSAKGWLVMSYFASHEHIALRYQNALNGHEQ